MSERTKANLNIDKDLWKEFKIYAVREGRTMTDILVDFIKRTLEYKSNKK